MVTLIVLVLNIWVAAYWLKSTMEGLQVELRSNIESLEDRLRRLEQSQTTSTELS